MCTRNSVAQMGNLFWFLPVGVVLALASLFEGSLLWAAFCLTTAWIGVAAGASSGAQVERRIRGLVESDQQSKLMNISMRDMVLFWGPNIAFICFANSLLHWLPAASKPGSYHFFMPLPMMEGGALYFCWTGAAWYRTWKWSRGSVLAIDETECQDLGPA